MKNNKKFDLSEGIHGQPDTAEKLINKYGTYNIQPTNDSDNEYPAIAQGISEITKKERRRDETTSVKGKKHS